MVMPNARRSAQQLKPFVKFRPRTLGGSGAVPGDVNENPFQAVPAIRVLSILGMCLTQVGTVSQHFAWLAHWGFRPASSSGTKASRAGQGARPTWAAAVVII